MNFHPSSIPRVLDTNCNSRKMFCLGSIDEQVIRLMEEILHHLTLEKENPVRSRISSFLPSTTFFELLWGYFCSLLCDITV